MPHTLKLDARDSGVTWRAYKNEKPLLIGGKTVSGFEPWKGGILKANVGAQGVTNALRQLFFDGRRMHLARYPNFDPHNPCGYERGPIGPPVRRHGRPQPRDWKRRRLEDRSRPAPAASFRRGEGR